MRRIILIGLFVTHFSYANEVVKSSPDEFNIENSFHRLIIQTTTNCPFYRCPTTSLDPSARDQRLKTNVKECKSYDSIWINIFNKIRTFVVYHYEIIREFICGRILVFKFNLHSSIFEGNIVHGETVFISNKKTRYRLAFPPSEIVKIYDIHTEEIYLKGRDYIETKDGFELTKKSKIMPSPIDVDKARENKIEELNIINTDNQRYQYGVTYIKEKKFTLQRIGNINELRSRIGKDLLKVTFFGDSITIGDNSTNYAYPNQPGYVDLVMGYLSAYYPNKWIWRNNAVSGWTTNNAVAALDYRVLNMPSDLYVIAFGMDDSVNVEPKDYKTNIINMLARIKKNNPHASVLLISPSRSNPSSERWHQNYFSKYACILKQIALENDNVVLADVTAAWNFMLKNKNHYDLAGNGLNYPNDFGHRVMAEVVLSTILGRSP